MDLQKQIGYWQASAEEDWDASLDLAKSGRFRHSLFFAHLALEKILKAHVCRKTSALPPKIHSLLRLAKESGLQFNAEQIEFLAKFDRFQVQGRYPDAVPVELDTHLLRAEMAEAEKILEWLKNRL
jgi:HEPN domain-containing protein